jgi:hypothetical protein
MERLVTVMCWLFNSEQHLDKNIFKLKEENHQVVAGEVTFERKKKVRYEVVLGEWGLETFMKNCLHPPHWLIFISRQVPCAVIGRIVRLPGLYIKSSQMGPRPGMTVKCVVQWSLIGRLRII